MANFPQPTTTKIRAVVFDLDGVLIDAGHWHFQALNRALRVFGFSISDSDHRAIYDGFPTASKLEILSNKTSFPRKLHPLVRNLKQQYTEEIISANCRSDPEKTRLITELRAEGYRLAVASNCVRNTVDRVLSQMGIRDCFDCILSNEDVEHPKPHPDMYLKCLKLLRCEASEMVIFEDSMPGLEAARKVTRHVVSVSHPREVVFDWVTHKIESISQTTRHRLLEIVIPMAGLGQRFHDAGYEIPKPFIPIFGKPMIQWVVENICPKSIRYRLTFLCNEKHIEDFGVKKLLQDIAPGSRLLKVAAPTEGALCTLLLASDLIDPESNLLVANSDQWVNASIDDFISHAHHTAVDGLIMTFQASDKKWSYAKLDASGKVTEVAEKKPISPHATVGIYYFKKSSDFIWAAEKMLLKDTRTNGEFYLCPVYNELIWTGKTIKTFEIPIECMHGLGTPEDLQLFVQTKGPKLANHPVRDLTF